MWIRVRLPRRVGFRKFFSEYMHIKSFEIFLYIYLELRKPGQQTFCNFSQLPLSNGLFTELFAYVVFFWFLLWFGLCVDVAVDRISNFFLPPLPPSSSPSSSLLFIHGKKIRQIYNIPPSVFIFFILPTIQGHPTGNFEKKT